MTKVPNTPCRIFLLLFFLTLHSLVTAQDWKPDAGYVKPFPAVVSVSSGVRQDAITDGNPKNYWSSDNPLPFHYVSADRENYLKNLRHLKNRPALQKYAAAFDGNQNTKSEVLQSFMRFELLHPTELKLLTLKADNSELLRVVVHYSDSTIDSFAYGTDQKFQLHNYWLKQKQIVAVELKSKKPFNLFEMAALKEAPTEFVQLDFEKPCKIGWLSTRHLNTKGVQSIGVYSSMDGLHWHHLFDLNPQSIPFLQIPLKKEVTGRYLRVVFTLGMSLYSKAVLWEFAAYDRYGPYGKPPKAKVSKNDFEHAFGINTIWGWGYSVYSDRLKPGTGPGKFRSLTSMLRTYHRLDWDIKSPGELPDYAAMAKGKGTPANDWLNWDREYKYWKSFGYHIDASILFKENNFPDTLWQRPYDEAFAFGKLFGEHFGKKGKPLIDRVEIGNEPWSYKKSVYRQLLAGMSLGIHSVSDMKIYTCAVQAYDRYHESNNYIAGYVTQNNSRWIDGLNTHIYSYVFREDGKRVAVMPEDGRSEVWSIANLVRYRDVNLPGKTIEVTEFGFDATGGGESCTHAECVSEEQQAVFGARMALILWRLGAEHFYWYYFANVQYDSFLHNRSGLCGSYGTGFKKKLAFSTFEKIYQLLGPYHFYKVAREDNQVYAYWFKNFTNGKRLLVVWRPVEKVAVAPRWITLPVSDYVNKITPLLEGFSTPYEISPGKLKLKLAGSPVFVEF